jgi:hypothetical protein
VQKPTRIVIEEIALTNYLSECEKTRCVRGRRNCRFRAECGQSGSKTLAAILTLQKPRVITAGGFRGWGENTVDIIRLSVKNRTRAAGFLSISVCHDGFAGVQAVGGKKD